MTTIPTISELYIRQINAIEAEYGETVPSFGKVFLRVLAAVQSVIQKMQYLTLANVQKNIFCDTADSELNGGTLERFGRVKLNRDPFPAVAGVYNVTITGTIGGTVNSLTTFKSNDNATSPGKLFILDTTFTLVASTGTISLRALESGTDSRLAVGDTLTSTIPIALVSSTATVLLETTEPLAAETIEDYRTKVIAAYRTETQGGAGGDYRLWSYDAQGVEQTYPYAKSGAANEINLFVEATIADSTDGKGTPSAGLLTDVEEVIELDPDTTLDLNERGRRPLGVFAVNILPVTIKNITIEIADFVGITTPIETLLFDAIEEMVNEVRPFCASCDVLEDKNDILDTNKIIAAILNARPGSVFGAVTLYVDAVSVSTFTFENGDIPYLDTVTYV